MWFLVLKLLKVGVSEAKKHKEAKKQQQQQQGQSSDSINLDPNTKSATATTTEEMLSFNPNSNTTQNPLKAFLDAFLRLLQFTLGLVIIGLYGQHLTSGDDGDGDAGERLDSRCLYAVITGSLTSLTAFVYLVLMFILRNRTPLARREGWLLPVFAWEGVLWLLWLVAFGIFAKIYLPDHGSGHGGGEKMWRAVWVDLAGWVVSGVCLGWCGLRWWKRGGLGAVRSGAGGQDVEKGGV